MKTMWWWQSIRQNEHLRLLSSLKAKWSLFQSSRNILKFGQKCSHHNFFINTWMEKDPAKWWASTSSERSPVTLQRIWNLKILKVIWDTHSDDPQHLGWQTVEQTRIPLWTMVAGNLQLLQKAMWRQVRETKSELQDKFLVKIWQIPSKGVEVGEWIISFSYKGGWWVFFCSCVEVWKLQFMYNSHKFQ